MKTAKPSPDHLSTTEASHWLSNTVTAAKNWTYALEANRRGLRFREYGVIPFVKLKGKIFYHGDDLVAFARKYFGATWATI